MENINNEKTKKRGPWTEEQKRKAARTRAERKEKAKNLFPTIVLQHNGQDIDVSGFVTEATSRFRQVKKRAAITEFELYVKPEDSAAYYVINKEFKGKIEY